MKLSIGIVGLPNVGKSTLFNALLKKTVANVANYPFCTIEPNVGVVEVPDARLPVLAGVVRTQTIIPAIVEFYDIAGLVKGASEGEGLGNKFLSHIREVAAICHVVRLFEDDEIVHVNPVIDPEDDARTIETELIMADLSTLDKQKEPRGNGTKEEKSFYELVKLLKSELNKGIPARKIPLTTDQIEEAKPLNLLSMKPVLFVVNVSESQLGNKLETEGKIQEMMKKMGETAPYLFLCAKLENEILAFSETEQKDYLKQFELEEIGLNRLIKEAYKLLNLISFLTAGEKEVRAWTIYRGTLAPDAAGVIHTDFTKKFIKADIASFETFVECGGWVKAREVGKVLSAGKDYVMKEGDVVEFKIGN